MAYSPVEQGRILNRPALRAVAARHRATPAQVALAWLLRNPDIMVIPKASDPAHVRENRGAADLVLTAQDLTELDREFPAHPKMPARNAVAQWGRPFRAAAALLSGVPINGDDELHAGHGAAGRA